MGIASPERQAGHLMPPAIVINRQGASRFVLLCDHARNRFPARYGDLGLTPTQRLMHIAWDPGALGVAMRLSDRLDAPLIYSSVSRLIVDPNRAPDAPDLIPSWSENEAIAANANLADAERAARIAAFHTPYHAAIDAVISARTTAPAPIVVAIHSFTPTYDGVARPWPAGILPARDTGFSAKLRDTLSPLISEGPLGWNEPYPGTDAFSYTIRRHADGNGLPGTVIEIRQDEILEPSGVVLWADRLAGALEAAREAFG